MLKPLRLPFLFIINFAFSETLEEEKQKNIILSSLGIIFFKSNNTFYQIETNKHIIHKTKFIPLVEWPWSSGCYQFIKIFLRVLKSGGNICTRTKWMIALLRSCVESDSTGFIFI